MIQVLFFHALKLLSHNNIAHNATIIDNLLTIDVHVRRNILYIKEFDCDNNKNNMV